MIFAGANRIYSRGQDRFASLQGETAGLIDGDGKVACPALDLQPGLG